MRRIWNGIREFTRRGDLLLLLFCVLTTLFGIIMIASTTRFSGSHRFLIVQTAALGVGILLYAAVSLMDIEILAEHWLLLMGFNTVFILLLRRWGIEVNGNRAWLKLPLLPVNVQPAEICKITFVIILAKLMNVNHRRLSSPRSVLAITAVTVFMLGLIIVISKDAGSAMVFLFIFLVMAYLGGVRGWWFLVGAVLVVLVFPEIWSKLFQPYQRERIMVVLDPTIDPTGEGVRWDTNRSIAMISGGGVSGQGLFRGAMTQSHAVDSQYSDFIFSAIGEELGILGCMFAVFLELIIILRCIHVGLRTPNYMNRMICFGISAMLMFQVLTNVGMCIGVFPVIGLTLPFISYGGSSIITMFLAMGFISGIHMRPDPEAKSPYIQPRY